VPMVFDDADDLIGLGFRCADARQKRLADR